MSTKNSFNNVPTNKIKNELAEKNKGNCERVSLNLGSILDRVSKEHSSLQESYAVLLQKLQDLAKEQESLQSAKLRIHQLEGELQSQSLATAQGKVDELNNRNDLLESRIIEMKSLRAFDYDQQCSSNGIEGDDSGFESLSHQSSSGSTSHNECVDPELVEGDTFTPTKRNSKVAVDGVHFIQYETSRMGCLFEAQERQLEQLRKELLEERQLTTELKQQVANCQFINCQQNNKQNKNYGALYRTIVKKSLSSD